jgi:ABC-type transporter Mla MlaB component
MTTTKSSRKRKSSTRAQPKRATAFATRAVPAVNPAVPTATASTAAQTNGEMSAAAMHVLLEPGLEIKDAEGVHRLLSAALVEGRAIAVDVGRVQAVDTAGAQLLLAFQGEASRRGVTIEFRGESAPLLHTLAVLGLRDKLSFAVPHDG